MWNLNRVWNEFLPSEVAELLLRRIGAESNEAFGALAEVVLGLGDPLQSGFSDSADGSPKNVVWAGSVVDQVQGWACKVGNRWKRGS